MGETGNPKGDVLTPEGTKGLTPKEPETLTRQEHEAAIAKAKSDTMADVKRLETEWKKSQNIAEKAMSRLKEIEEENYRRQEETARDDPDELSRIRRERQTRDREAKLEERESKVQTQIERLLKVNAKALSQQYNVPEETLLEFAGNDAERMENLAKSFGERKEAGESQGKTVTRMTQAPDDGKTKGGSGGLTIEDVRKMSPEEQNARRAEIAKLPLTLS